MDNAELADEKLRSLAREIANTTADQLKERRQATLKEVCRRRIELRSEEEKLHQSVEPGLRKVLEGKQLLLLAERLEKINHPDKSLPEEIRRGFRITGKGSTSNVFDDFSREAPMTTDDLAARARLSVPSTLKSTTSSGDQVLDQQVYRETQEEAAKGWIRGPISEAELWATNGGSIAVTKRFGISRATRSES